MHRAGLPEQTIALSVANACSITAPVPEGMIITNPPYGERLTAEEPWMSQWAAQLKQSFTGWSVFVISDDTGLPGHMRLKPPASERPVFNGALDCRLYAFEMVADSYRTK